MLRAPNEISLLGFFFCCFKLMQLKGEYVLGINCSQRNKILHPSCLPIAFVDLGEFDSKFRMMPSSV